MLVIATPTNASSLARGNSFTPSADFPTTDAFAACGLKNFTLIVHRKCNPHSVVAY